MKSLYRNVALLVVFITLSISGYPSLVHASHNEGTSYEYLIATGALCSLPEPNPCPVVMRGENGETIEITGQGTLTVNPDSVTGGGNFVHKDNAGNVLGIGTWTATELVSFRSWGTQGDLPPNFEGGRAKIRVHLTPDGGGAGFDGSLRIICTIGDFPSSSHEGVELTLWRAPNFTEKVSGLTLFIRND